MGIEAVWYRFAVGLTADDLAKHRPELLRYCYRMIGTIDEADDLVQETLLRAWKHRDDFENRSSIRTWLFRIATNACLNALEYRARRQLPQDRRPAEPLGATIAPRITEPIWLEPYPDDPHAAIQDRETIGLAFVSALQRLPAKQRAVLLLRDVIEYEASEVATLLETTVGAVESALHRARTTLDQPAKSGTVELGPDDRVLLANYVAAWERGDIAALVALFRDDAVFAMPPVPSWFSGRAAIRVFLETNSSFVQYWRDGFRLTPLSANGGPAFGVYKRADDQTYRAHGLMVVTVVAGVIASVTTFLEPRLFGRFGLPAVN